MKMKLIKRLVGPTAIFKIVEIEVKKERVKRNIVEFPKTVGILPVLNNGKIILIKQYRFPIKKEIWEIPAGKLKKNEKPKVGARRELKEEVGYEAKKLKKTGEFYLSPGYSSEYMYLFRATELKKGEPMFDKGEKIKKIRAFKIESILKMIRNGKIKDAKTILAILFEKFFRT